MLSLHIILNPALINEVHYIDAEVNKQESKSPFSVNTYDQIVFDEANGLDYRNMYF